MQRVSPIPVFKALVIPIVFSLAFGCSSHLTTGAASSPLPPDASKVTTPAAVAPMAASGQPGLDVTPASPPLEVPKQISATVAQQDSPVMVIAASTFPSTPKESLAVVFPSETSRKVQVVVGRIVDLLLRLDGVAWMGLAAIAAMLIFYALEDRSPFFTVAFAAACGTGSAYGVLQRSCLIGLVGAIWGCLALRKWWWRIRSKKNAEDRVVIWPVRVISVLAVISGVVLLVVDSPLSTQLPITISRAFAEAIPLLLVGIAFLAWLAIDRPPIIDLIKQIFIAVAFILWGVNLLMPSGRWARFVGAVVIAIYVFDLAWLMEGNLRKRFIAHSTNGDSRSASSESESFGVCTYPDNSLNSRTNRDGSRSDKIGTSSAQNESKRTGLTRDSLNR